MRTPEAKLVINCDDVLSSALISRCKNPVVTYGINEPFFDNASSTEIRESTFCRFCGEKLEYDFFHYGQLGIYRCPGCGWKRPYPDYCADHMILAEKGYCFDIGDNHICSGTDSPYNIYNTLSVYAAICGMKLPAESFKAAVESFDYGNNREEAFTINGARVQLYLAKNPVGFQQKIAMLVKDKKPKDILIKINDTFQDGKDVSWLWDVDFGYLKDGNAVTIAVAGSRRHDMALRLKYENIPCSTVRHMRQWLEQLSINGTGNIYIVVNYSGLAKTNRMLNKLQDSKKEELE